MNQNEVNSDNKYNLSQLTSDVDNGIFHSDFFPIWTFGTNMVKRLYSPGTAYRAHILSLMMDPPDEENGLYFIRTVFCFVSYVSINYNYFL